MQSKKYREGERIRGPIREFDDYVEVYVGLRFGEGRVILDNWTVEQELDEHNCLRKYAKHKDTDKKVELKNGDEPWMESDEELSVEIVDTPEGQQDHYHGEARPTSQISKKEAAGSSQARAPLETKCKELRNLTKL